MKATLITLAGLCALAVALATPASGAAVGVYPFHGSESNPSYQICGLDLNVVFSFTGVFVVKPSGATLNPNEFTSVFTNPATGKSIMIHAGAQLAFSAPIDNGDGTVSFIVSGTGNYIVKDTRGGPISLDAGRLVSRATFDATTGQLLSVELLSVVGPNPPSADNSCEGIVAALT